jgi:hypothetical protein
MRFELTAQRVRPFQQGNAVTDKGRRLAITAAAVVGLAMGSVAEAQSPIRMAPVAEASAATDRTHVLIGANEIVDGSFLVRHTHQANGGSFGDNAVVADFWYDGTHRRIVTRSLQLGDVDDPADLRLGRAGGTFPDTLDFRARHQPGTIVGHVGFVGWSQNGFGAYQTAVQGAQLDQTRGMLFLSAAPGRPGTSRAGFRYDADELVQHVALLPDGTVVIGYNTDPRQTPALSLIVRGNLRVEGTVFADKCVNVR